MVVLYCYDKQHIFKIVNLVFAFIALILSTCCYFI